MADPTRGCIGLSGLDVGARIVKSRAISKICDDLQQLLAKPLPEPDAVFELAEEVESHPKGIQAVAVLLLLLEKNAELDWGTPGPVVHAVEKFFKKGYVALLLESVLRTPTSHTLWMANRVVNGVSKVQKEKFLSAICAAAKRKDVAPDVREAAKGFLEFQDEV